MRSSSLINWRLAKISRTALEPLTVLAALAVSTSRIGLIATASTTYTEPFNLARQFASLDHISRGRIGWNIVTSWLAPAARNYGGSAQVSHAERYARAEEFLTVVKGLWDSWADDAELDDRVSGRYANPARIRPLNHAGAYYRVGCFARHTRETRCGRIMDWWHQTASSGSPGSAERS
jgi:alkanesulfonate monooxygenase SsuD/methylene tetrahydromethanopterin reductase-like flavin-dependent oxidoreductase (luciferase family)